MCRGSRQHTGCRACICCFAGPTCTIPFIGKVRTDSLVVVKLADYGLLEASDSHHHIKHQLVTVRIDDILP